MDVSHPDEVELRNAAQEEVDRRWPNRLEADVGLGVLSLRSFLLGAVPPAAVRRRRAPAQVIGRRRPPRRALPEHEE
jgi:hypothetical protein